MRNALALIALVFSNLCLGQQDEPKRKSDSLKWESTHKSWAKEPVLNDKSYNKLSISRRDSTMTLTSDIKKDHRIFGYGSPDKNSKKVLLFSVWTHDVEGNPCKCAYGSYYQTMGIKDLDLKYLGTEKDFIKAGVYAKGRLSGMVYFEKRWTEFDD